MAAFSIATINVNGLRDNRKRNQVFSFLKNSKYDVICLQETHQLGSDKKRWAREWGGKDRSAWSNSNDATCRLAVLFRPQLNINIISQDEDFNGPG